MESALTVKFWPEMAKEEASAPLAVAYSRPPVATPAGIMMAANRFQRTLPTAASEGVVKGDPQGDSGTRAGTG